MPWKNPQVRHVGKGGQHSGISTSFCNKENMTLIIVNCSNLLLEVVLKDITEKEVLTCVFPYLLLPRYCATSIRCHHFFDDVMSEQYQWGCIASPS